MPDLADLQILGINEQTDDYTAVLSDLGKMIEMNKATANTFTIPAHADVAFPTATVSVFHLMQTGAGTTTVVWATGITVNGVDGADGNIVLSGQWKSLTFYQSATNTWRAIGGIA